MMDASLIRSMRQNHLLLPLSNLHSPLILNIPIEPSVSSEHKINTKRPPHPRSQTDIEKGFILNHDLFHIADLPKKNLPPADTAIKNENYKAWQHLLDSYPNDPSHPRFHHHPHDRITRTKRRFFNRLGSEPEEGGEGVEHGDGPDGYVFM